ncbi:hypothetical protein MHYP_G00200100 [Metynnis hypsauchen]
MGREANCKTISGYALECVTDRVTHPNCACARRGTEAASHPGGVLLSDNGRGRARSSYLAAVLLKWDLVRAQAEAQALITDQGGLSLKQSCSRPEYTHNHWDVC